MILVTRLNGDPFAVNPDLVMRAEASPDTVLTLTDGTKYLVSESVEEIVRLVREFRASVGVLTQQLLIAAEADADAPGPSLRLVPAHDREV